MTLAKGQGLAWTGHSLQHPPLLGLSSPPLPHLWRNCSSCWSQPSGLRAAHHFSFFQLFYSPAADFPAPLFNFAIGKWQTLQQSALPCILPGCCPFSLGEGFTIFSTGGDNYTTCPGPLRDTTYLSVWVLLICTFLLSHRSSLCPCLSDVSSILTRLFSSAAWSPFESSCCSFQDQNLCLSLEATVAFFHTIWLGSLAIMHLQDALCWASPAADPRSELASSSVLYITHAYTLESQALFCVQYIYIYVYTNVLNTSSTLTCN